MADRVPRKAVASLLRRADGHCERCGVGVADPEAAEFDDRGVVWSVQHRKPAGMGGTNEELFNSPANLALLCGSGTTGCHGEVESHRTQAREDGWLVWQSWDPAQAPMRVFGRGLVLLTDDWGYAPAGVTLD